MKNFELLQTVKSEPRLKTAISFLSAEIQGTISGKKIQNNKAKGSSYWTPKIHQTQFLCQF